VKSAGARTPQNSARGGATDSARRRPPYRSSLRRSVALIDLDRFKALNDQLGHATGDRVLKEFAAIATASIRSTDTLGRWGGEEFLLLLPDTTLDTAMEILDRMRQLVAAVRAASNTAKTAARNRASFSQDN
jgi:diguanylate cyclase (GGDEF)-like protein